MATIALQQVSSPFARRNARRTLEKPIALKYLTNFLREEDVDAIGAESDKAGIFVWGAKYERTHQMEKMLLSNFLVLFRRSANVYKTGAVVHSVVNGELAEALWGLDSDGQPWGWVWFFRRIRDIDIAASEINRLVGRTPANHWQGMVAVAGEPADAVVALVKERLQDLSTC